jgi:DNA-binding response OmpR family regulator
LRHGRPGGQQHGCEGDEDRGFVHVAGKAHICRGGGDMLFHFGDHALDPERRELHRGLELIPIEPQVFDLLVHLMRNRDRVISKDELIETVWGGRW